MKDIGWRVLRERYERQRRVRRAALVAWAVGVGLLLLAIGLTGLPVGWLDRGLLVLAALFMTAGSTVRIWWGS